ncbi:putative NAD-dependent epimerase/dehydratase family protein [Luteimonas cucumeris]|uniref:Putative NAD-dependent epimerase/dehydratase family protein n=1 Tax=Luteimonas cucumeris TaxID=985012 RepID=A0A562LEF8_9GAMM|nr:N-acetyltransferase DgcN [Luteimonas cucumeris]TWI05946.1 putative NAD-dependent epimerase/dehydratase family protein [Luteimonas cucumeris]
MSRLDPLPEQAGHASRWPPPFLLYLGNAADDLAAKTARGLAHWRPGWCVGQYRDVDCRATLGLADLDFAQARAAGANTMIVGVANAGGRMDAHMVDHMIAALDAGMNVASGLHERLSAHPRIVAAAERNGRFLFDAREAPKTPVGNGGRRAGRRLLTVGTDCSVGKMYTTLALEQEMHRRGLRADFRATGQTGIFIAGSGIPIDAVVADFISGGIEWLSPARDDGGWDLIEGQGSLFHPSYAGVSLGLLHGAQPDALVLCHEPDRPHMRGLRDYPLPALAACLEANLQAARLTSPEVIVAGVALNTSRLAPEAAARACREVEEALGVPAEDPVTMGVSRIVDRLQASFAG